MGEVTRTTRLETIQLAEDGSLLVRIQKRTSLDSEVLRDEWHRTSIPPGGDIAAQMAAVDAHLATMGFDPLPAESVTLLEQVGAAVQTDDVKSAYERARSAGIKPDA